MEEQKLKAKLKYNQRGVLSNKQTPEAIKQVLSELKSGVTPESILEQYKIGKIETLKEWQRRYGIGEEIKTAYRVFPAKLKRQIVYELENKILSLHEAERKYEASGNAIRLWIKQYSCQKQSKMTREEEHEKSSEQTINVSDKKFIEELQLKILGLEAMIDIAEEQLKISIRKKYGTKQ